MSSSIINSCCITVIVRIYLFFYLFSFPLLNCVFLFQSYVSNKLKQSPLTSLLKFFFNFFFNLHCSCRCCSFYSHHIPKERRGVDGTIAFCRALEQVGVSMICVHARDRHNKGTKIKNSNWEAIRR